MAEVLDVDKLDLNSSAPASGTSVTDELHTDVGSSAFNLNHDLFLGSTDLVIRTAASGGGTLLVSGTDYTVSGLDSDVTTLLGVNVYTQITVINGVYQTGDLYFTYKCIADQARAESLNTLGAQLDVSGADFTLDAKWRNPIVRYITGASDRTCTLPDANSNVGKTITIVKMDTGAGSVLCVPAGTDKIDFVFTSIELDSIGASVQIISIGSGCWKAVSYIDRSNIDLSGATSDYDLQIGQTAVINFTAATSVPLHIATGDGSGYEIFIVCVGQVTAFLYPNNTLSGLSILSQYLYASNTTMQSSRATNTGFSLGINGTVQFWGTISNYTLQKTMLGNAVRIPGTSTLQSALDIGWWNDTTTVWSSLGTIILSSAVSGRVLVKRIA